MREEALAETVINYVKGWYARLGTLVRGRRGTPLMGLLSVLNRNPMRSTQEATHNWCITKPCTRPAPQACDGRR